MREQLAAVLLTATTEYGAAKAAPEVDLFDFYADALLPTVRKIAAAELDAAANGIGDWPGVGNAIKGQLRDRAAALGPTS